MGVAGEISVIAKMNMLVEPSPLCLFNDMDLGFCFYISMSACMLSIVKGFDASCS